jgi:hypothetical protein
MEKLIQPSVNLAFSMRDMGYSFETALADVIDNSLAAGAKRIDIMSPPEYPLILAIADDGAGMSENEIIEAFTLAMRPPEEVRDNSDLGRFGLGMKTASWSQCRKITLASSSGGKLSAASLDLDTIRDTQKWVLEVLDADTISKLRFIDCLAENGTLLIWEKLDRIEQGGEEASKQQLRKLLAEAKDHLQLVFHRFLEQEAGYPKAIITINGIPLEPENPFYQRYTATLPTPIEAIDIQGKGKVRIQAFTLPHHNKVSKQEWEHMGRKEGHLKNQGFYLYRERRLILWGTWFRMMRQQELFKLTRVKIDIPNTMDEDWQINIMKSSACPPRKVYERLSNLLDNLGAPSKRVYKNRGTALLDQPYTVWQKVIAQGMISYRIEESHPVVEAFMKKLSDSECKQFEHVMEVVAAALPVESLYSDFGSTPELIDVAKMPEEDIRMAVLEILPKLKAIYPDKDVLLNILKLQEPYRSNFETVKKIVSEEADG